MRAPKFVTMGAVLLLVSIIACSQRVETEAEHAAREPERPRLPAAAAPAALVAGSAGTAGAMPRGAAEIIGPNDGAGSVGPGVAGVVQAPGLTSPPQGTVLFVIVRPADRDSGPPLAVQRLSPSAFPLAFSIGPADAMMGPAPFPERVVVEARLDADGDPLSRDAGDLWARSGPVSPGSEGVTLTLAAPVD